MTQATNVLHRPVKSVYPNELHEGMCFDFNRHWSMQVAENGFPVHFVPLLKAVSCCFT